MYMAVNLAAIGYYWRERRDEFNWLKHLIVPVIGFILMIPAFLGVLGGVTIPILDLELASARSSRTRSSRRWSGSGCSIGIVIGLYFWFRERDKLRSVREAMGETDEVAPATPATPAAPATPV